MIVKDKLVISVELQQKILAVCNKKIAEKGINVGISFSIASESVLLSTTQHRLD